MQFDEFQRIVKTFAYCPEDVCVEPGKVFLQLHDEIIEVDLIYNNDQDLVVIDNGVNTTPKNWIVQRLAKIEILAGRIQDMASNKSPLFVDTSGSISKTIEGGEETNETIVDNVLSSVVECLSNRIPGATSVLYLTAAAGEGKTTIIQEIARYQASAFKKRDANWLLIPIELGGRRIIRLDDHIVGSLANTFRFPYLYYGTFLELVKMGVIVPALDGFEEMFVENATRDVLSALGSLLNSLGSKGNLLIAARNAYFEYHGWETQSRLFDSIDKDIHALFSRIKINSWEMRQFCEYGSKRGFQSPQKLYEQIKKSLGDDHPILTRPVLVEQLFTVAQNSEIDSLQKVLRSGSQDYFTNFIRAIIEREAKQKWIDVVGISDNVAKPLMSIDQHCDLLSDIALEMWRDGVDHISEDMLDTITEIFCSQFSDVSINRQIRERVKDHALLKLPIKNAKYYTFDHEEFKNYFLGWAIGKLICRNDDNTLRTVLRVGPIPPQSLETIDEFIKKDNSIDSDIVIYLNRIIAVEGPTSYCRENVGGILSRLLARIKGTKIVVNRMIFPARSLNNADFEKIEFIDCYFQPMVFHENQFKECNFTNCIFERIELTAHDISVANDCRLRDCEIKCLFDDNIKDIYVPGQISHRMLNIGFTSKMTKNEPDSPLQEPKTDPELYVTERALRAFRRATQVNENTLKNRLGRQGSFFVHSVLPKLQNNGIFEEVGYRGSGQQRRFRLGTPMSQIQECLQNCSGKFDRFVHLLHSKIKK